MGRGRDNAQTAPPQPMSCHGLCGLGFSTHPRNSRGHRTFFSMLFVFSKCNKSPGNIARVLWTLGTYSQLFFLSQACAREGGGPPMKNIRFSKGVANQAGSLVCNEGMQLHCVSHASTQMDFGKTPKSIQADSFWITAASLIIYRSTLEQAGIHRNNGKPQCQP